ncbi:BON domain-containing protein [Aquabacter spiritensis]|uniref:BON domain-containing protein n=1 Tax=Aquabacter spiritensis TaxID=933073 RepID=UPI0014055C12|nr:BON domain-containing protein [Aquabacter spiritensis]
MLAIGALCLIVIAALAVAQRGAIEADLGRRAQALLLWSGEGWASASFVGRDAVVTGEALAEEARAKVRAGLGSIDGVRRVIDATTLLPERRPFTFSAARDGGVLQLSGYVPSEAARTRIGEAARAVPGITAVKGLDRLVRARGAPAGDFASVVAFGLDQLARLPTGRIILSDDALSIEGRSPDLATYDRLSRTLHGPLPQGFRLARFAVRPPVVSPFLWSALREGQQVRALGHVPSAEARAAVLSALAAAVPGAEVIDEMRLGDGAPSGALWVKAVTYAVMQLALLPKGRVTLSDTAIAIEGQAPSFDIYDALQSARRAPPEGFSVMRFAVEPPVATPFTWRVHRTAERLVLSGYVVSEEAKRGIADAVRGLFPGVPVSDETRIAGGGPPAEQFAAMSRFALALLARMGRGEADLSGGRLSLAGEALDAEAFAAATKMARQPPPGVELDRFTVRPPLISPFVFVMRRDAKGITLSGFLPDAAAQAAVGALLADLYPGETVQDVTGLGSGAPEGFAAAVKAGLLQSVRLEPAELRLTDRDLLLAGDVPHAAAAGQVLRDVTAALPEGFRAATEIAPAEPGAPLTAAECVPLAASLASPRQPTFEAGLSRPDSRGAAFLDRLARIALRCPEAVVEVAPEPVSGAPAAGATANARAMAVIAHLAEAGIEPSRIRVVPLASGAPGEEGVAVHLRPAAAGAN